MAAVIFEGVLQVLDDGSVRVIAANTSPPAAGSLSDLAATGQAVETVMATFPGSEVNGHPWAPAAPPEAPSSPPPWATTTQAAPGSWTPPPSQPVPAYNPPAAVAPSCAHGPLKAVPAGVSMRTGQPYKAFWACTAPQGAPKCRLDPKTLPPL